MLLDSAWRWTLLGEAASCFWGEIGGRTIADSVEKKLILEVMVGAANQIMNIVKSAKKGSRTD